MCRVAGRGGRSCGEHRPDERCCKYQLLEHDDPLACEGRGSLAAVQNVHPAPSCSSDLLEADPFALVVGVRDFRTCGRGRRRGAMAREPRPDVPREPNKDGDRTWPSSARNAAHHASRIDRSARSAARPSLHRALRSTQQPTRPQSHQLLQPSLDPRRPHRPTHRRLYHPIQWHQPTHLQLDHPRRTHQPAHHRPAPRLPRRSRVRASPPWWTDSRSSAPPNACSSALR